MKGRICFGKNIGYDLCGLLIKELKNYFQFTQANI